MRGIFWLQCKEWMNSPSAVMVNEEAAKDRVKIGLIARVTKVEAVG